MPTHWNTRKRREEGDKKEKSEGCWGNTRRNLLIKTTSLHRKEAGLNLLN